MSDIDYKETISNLIGESQYDLTKKKIFVTWQKEGIHKYPNAPEGVEFLQHPHRHMFHFRVEIDVFHNDREIEFILFKRELESLYQDGILELDYKSCEMMSDDLADYIYENYSHRDFVITVSEDGENGAICHYPKNENGIH
jgi:hypothetical protein|tara:strand:+ start:893 stop:1315 length:423 start_codon:yes stop_codon:yes gene_type:complete